MTTRLRRTALRSALTLSALTLGPFAMHSVAMPLAPFQEAAQEAAPASEGTKCACTCEACMAKHGEKAAGTAITAEVESLQDDLARIQGLVAAAEVNAEESVAQANAAAEAEPVAPMVQAAAAAAAPAAAAAAPAAPAAPKERGYMGVTLGMDDGVVLNSVVPNSPAAKAGLMAGDIVVAVEEMPIDATEDMMSVMEKLGVGDVVSIEVERGDEELTFAFELGKREVLNLGNDTLIRTAVPEAPPLPDVDIEALREIGYLAGADVEMAEERIVLPTQVAEVMDDDGTVRIGLIDLGDARGENAAGAPSTGFFFIADDASGEEVEIEVEEVMGAGQSLRARQWAAAQGPSRDGALRGGASREGAAGRRAAPTENGDGWKTQLRERSDDSRIPEGYIEIETRRERRPVGTESGAMMKRRIEQLEREVAELSAMIEEMRAELRRRNPR